MQLNKLSLCHKKEQVRIVMTLSIRMTDQFIFINKT